MLFGTLPRAKDKRLNKIISYWIAQSVGWGALITMGLLFQQEEVSWITIAEAAGFFITGIGLSQILRFIILKLNWLKLKVLPLIPLVLLSSILMGALFLTVELTIDFFRGQSDLFGGVLSVNLKQLFSFSIYFFFWSVIYFGFHFFERARDQEINNIKLSSSQNEIELLNLRAQLNPHFMFNSMNSIRALIDEDPDRAKSAITKLSKLLRSTLLSGKKHLQTFGEEVEIVRDYLDLEKIRFEERLNYDIKIRPELLTKQFPPLLLQTLAENAVKHGISNLSEGGQIIISGDVRSEKLVVEVLNSGTYRPDKQKRSTGIGLENSKKRLNIIFGSRATMTIGNENGFVKTQIEIPLDKMN